MQIELSSDKLLLRPPRSEDAAALFEAVEESLETVGRWLPWCHRGYHLGDSVAWIDACCDAWNREESYPFFIFDRASQRFLGGCGLNEIDRLRLLANLGYWVRSSAQGEGVATESAQLVARYGVEQLGFMRLEIIAAQGNLASQRVAAKLGATREGLFRNRLRVHGIQHDAYGYSLIPSDVRCWR